MTGYNVSANTLDATQRHPGMDWNSDTGVWLQKPNFPDHVVDTPQHSNPNTAGVVMIRAYLDDTPSEYATNPQIIVRDVASGCASPSLGLCGHARDRVVLVVGRQRVARSSAVYGS